MLKTYHLHMENEIEIPEVEETPEEIIEEVETEEEQKEEPKVEKPKETPEQKEARLERQLKQVRKQLGKEETKEAKPIKKATGDLDEMQLDYLDLKGISDDEDIEIIQNVVKKTGQTVRQALKDDYVVAKLEQLKNKRQEALKDKEVSRATPSSARRSGASVSNDVDFWYAKFEKDGTLPDDFELRSKVINKRVEKDNNNKPSWHK